MQALVNIVKSFSKTTNANQCDTSRGTESSQAKTVIKNVQQEIFGEEINRLSEGKEIPSHSLLERLDPFVDSEGLLREGGRLQTAEFSDLVKHPLIIPSSHHIATLLVRHYHNQVAHQGCQLTEGALRNAGLWVLGVKRLVSSIIHKCVTCRRLGGRVNEQKMAALPADRLTVNPPFTYVGVDVFGPWNATSRHTRSNSAESKRWAVMFKCLCTRAMYIKVVECMSTSSLINALR